MTIPKEFRAHALFRQWNDPNREQKIKAALELTIFSIDDICDAGLFHREYVEQLSRKHCPDAHQANMSRQSTATSEELADLTDILGILGKFLKEDVIRRASRKSA